jgi:hypothetical protein
MVLSNLTLHPLFDDEGESEKLTTEIAHHNTHLLKDGKSPNGLAALFI